MKRLLTLSILFCSLHAQAQDARIQKIDSMLTSLHKGQKINGNILIAEKGNVIYKKSFGLANNTTGAALNENSVFELASCSKQFTAMGIAILSHQKRLKLDDDVAKYVPELSIYKGVTIRHLLHHTSGLPDYMILMDSLWDKKKTATNNDMLALFELYKPDPLFLPNAQFEYSNTGYAVLATIIERVSNMDYGTFLKKNIFTPLKMNNSFVYRRRYKPMKVDNYAFGYLRDDNGKLSLPDSTAEENYVIYLDGIVGDGTVNSNLNDLLIWDRALYTSKLLTDYEMKAVFEPATLNDGKRSAYGFGWMLDSSAAFGKIVSHSGGWPGYMTYIERDITNDKTIIFLQNIMPSAVPIKALRNALYNKPMSEPVVARKEIKLSDEVLAQYVGQYQIAPAFAITVSQAGNQLKVQATGQPAFDIFPESETMFFLKVVNAQVEFVKEGGKVKSAILHQGGRSTEGPKVQ